MFSRFLKKSAREHEQLLNSLLKLDDTAFVETVANMVAAQHGASGAMCLVALENIRPILAFLKDHKRKNPQADFPETIEDSLSVLAKELDSRNTDEINERRHYWFFFSLLILRATRIGEHNDRENKAVVRMWCALVQGGQHIPQSLAHNILWSDLEKEWFAPLKTEKDGMMYVLNQMLPKWLRQHEDIKNIAVLGGIRSVGGHFM